jgi:adenosylcobinamide kinase/adenosylcobinamide-phosphate guanylyltransferase
MWKVGFILGGARSGKTRLALKIGEHFPPERYYIATYVPDPQDREMLSRIEHHRRERGSSWVTVESGPEVLEALSKLPPHSSVAVVDCLTLWLSWWLEKEPDDDLLLSKGDSLLKGAMECNGSVVFVSNEVGLGIVPFTKEGRRFRDLSGWLHQKVAEKADWVLLMVAGIPIVLKGERKYVLG